MINVLKTGPLNTVQDLGRFGFRSIGVTASGAMDSVATRIGNLLVGNAESAASIEIQTFPFKISFDRPTVFAITGADCRATLDGIDLPPWWVQQANGGQTLELSMPLRNARAYLSVAGGIDVPVVMGSRSTSLRGAFGGFAGRFLQNGDHISVAPTDVAQIPIGGFGVMPPAKALAEFFPVDEDGQLVLRAIPAGEHDLFAQDCERFWTQAWKITSQSDRTGYRLSGDPLKPDSPIEMRSHGVVPGVVQVPPGGEPIVQMSDANTAGGYPKIAGIIEVDIWRLAQARIGSRIRFVRSTVEEALAAEHALEGYLNQVTKIAPVVAAALINITPR